MVYTGTATASSDFARSNIQTGIPLELKVAFENRLSNIDYYYTMNKVQWYMVHSCTIAKWKYSVCKCIIFLP